jgi:hypothetical protein
MTFEYRHKPYAAFADGGQPLFWRRRYGGDPQPTRAGVDPTTRRMTVFVDLAPEQEIYIYGYSFDSEYAEDRDQQRHMWNNRRSFYAYCYSVMCPRGEPGFVPLDSVEMISQEDFETAAAKEWK